MRLIVGANPHETQHSVIMTTWHDQESLDEALWFFLNCAFPATDYEDSCRAELVVVIDNENWATQLKARLADQDALNRDVVGEGAYRRINYERS